jgi:hypothetical protein
MREILLRNLCVSYTLLLFNFQIEKCSEKAVVEIKIHILCSVHFFSKFYGFPDKVGIMYSKARPTTVYKIQRRKYSRIQTHI